MLIPISLFQCQIFAFLPLVPAVFFFFPFVLSFSFDGDLDGLTVVWSLGYPLARNDWSRESPQDFIIDLDFPPEEGATFIKITSIIQVEFFISLAGSRWDVCSLGLPFDLMRKHDTCLLVGGSCLMN